MIVGPRAVGKTTMLARRAASAVRLQRAAERDAVQADPYAVLRGLPRPTMIDEWQLVPEVLAAVKDAVDEGAPPGSFLITGSVRADLSPQGWPMTGRVVRLPMFGLTPRELRGRAEGRSFLDLAREELRCASHSRRPSPRPPRLRRTGIGQWVPRGNTGLVEWAPTISFELRRPGRRARSRPSFASR